MHGSMYVKISSLCGDGISLSFRIISQILYRWSCAISPKSSCTVLLKVGSFIFNFSINSCILFANRKSRIGFPFPNLPPQANPFNNGFANTVAISFNVSISTSACFTLSNSSMVIPAPVNFLSRFMCPIIINKAPAPMPAIISVGFELIPKNTTEAIKTIIPKINTHLYKSKLLRLLSSIFSSIILNASTMFQFSINSTKNTNPVFGSNDLCIGGI